MMLSTRKAATVRYAIAERFEVQQPIGQAGVLHDCPVELSTVVLSHSLVPIEYVNAGVLSSCCQQVANLIIVWWKAVPHANDETRRGERRAGEVPYRLKRLGGLLALYRSDQERVTSDRGSTIVIGH
jgi:hypothetical protein